MKNWERQELARELRKQGLSYSEIRKKIPVAKSTVSRWCRDIELTPDQKARLGALYDTQCRGAKANKIKRVKEVEEIKAIARSEFSKISKEEFKIAGLMLYWAEGYKTEHPGISNSDPKLIAFMMKWFREICHVPEEKFGAHLYIHSGQNEDRMERYWSEITGISPSQFGKSIFKKEGTGHRKNILYNGTLKINISDNNLLHRILGWIEGVNVGR